MGFFNPFIAGDPILTHLSQASVYDRGLGLGLGVALVNQGMLLLEMIQMLTWLHNY